MKKILYIHGFMSSANSSTVKRLKERFGNEFEIITPELDGDPHRSIARINDIITTEEPCLIVGSSLGGFYTLMSESKGIPVIVVNPCINPYQHLQRYLGQNLEYHSKREDGRTRYTLTQETLELFKDYDVAEQVKSKADRMIVLLSTQDEVLGDSHVKFFESITEESGHKNIVVKTSGDFGHRLPSNCFPMLADSLGSIMNPIEIK